MTETYEPTKSKKATENKKILQKLLDKQAELDERIREDRNLNFGCIEAELDKLCTAISNETEELRDETSWKWWSSAEDFSDERAKKELIDILHFWLSAANLLGLDAHSIEGHYTEKNKTNHKRQEEGY